MEIKINGVEVGRIVTAVTWSGSKSQAARKLEVEMLFDSRDARLPKFETALGWRVETSFFQGNIFERELDRAQRKMKLICFDDNFKLNRNKTTKKFTDALPEEIARSVCSEMGLSAGAIAATGKKVSFIAENKTFFQIIAQAYEEAGKKNERQYQCAMTDGKLNVVEKGNLCGVILDSAKNMTESIYRESIKELVNSVVVTDSQGNRTGEEIKDGGNQQYGRYQVLYKEQRDKNTAEEAKKLLKPVKREGSVTALGDLRATTGSSLIIKDELFKGKFTIESDTHHFKDNFHEMRLALDFETLEK